MNNIPAKKNTKGDFNATYCLSITYKTNDNFYYTDRYTGEIKKPKSLPRYSKKEGVIESDKITCLRQLIKNELINQNEELSKATLYLNLNCGNRINQILDKESYYYDEKFYRLINAKNQIDENGNFKIAKFVQNIELVKILNPRIINETTSFITPDNLKYPQINTHDFDEQDLFVHCQELINVKVPRDQANLIYLYYKYVFLDTEKHPLNNTPRKIKKPLQTEPSQEDKILAKKAEQEMEEERQKIELQEKEKQKIKANLETIKIEKIENIKNKGLEDWQIKTIISNHNERMSINDISIRTRIPIAKIKQVIADYEKNNVDCFMLNNLKLKNAKKETKEIKPFTQEQKENSLKVMESMCELLPENERAEAVKAMEKFKKENNL